MQDQRLADLFADSMTGVERHHRFLEDNANLTTPDLMHTITTGRTKILPLENNLTF